MPLYRSLGSRQAVKKFDWPLSKPKVCELTLNFDCNAKCAFCYSSPQLSQWSEGSISLKEAGVALLNAHGGGAWQASLIGGEITLRDDLPQIVSLAEKIGYKAIQIISNGIKLADYEYAKSLRDAGVNIFRISIQGCNLKLHDEIVGVKGAFKKSIKGIENLIKLGVKVAVNHVITDLNYRTFPQLIKFLVENYNIDAYSIVSPHYSGAMDINSQKLKVPYFKSALYVRKALRIFIDKKMELDAPILGNFVPCVLPGFENIMAEWKYPEKDNILFVPNESPSEICDMKAGQRMKNARCDKCVYHGECMGFEKKYFGLFGGKEFLPLKREPEKFKLSTVYPAG